MLYPFSAIYTPQRPLAWTTISQNVDPWNIVPPNYGQHLIIETNWRSAGAATAVALRVFINGDTTASNNHFQKAGAANGVANSTEATQANGMTIAGSTTVAGVYSPCYLIFPFFRSTTRQKVFHMLWTLEDAALSQEIFHVVQKRQGAGVTGTLLDPVTAIQFSNAAANATDGICRIAVTPDC
jgi:hypothetical protein